MNILNRLMVVAALLGSLAADVALGAPASRHAPLLTGAAHKARHFRRDAPRNQNNERVEELLQSALALYRQGKFPEALVKCTEAASLSPDDHRPHVMAGYVYMAQQKYKSGSEELAKAIALRPAALEFYILKASLDHERGAPEEALATCRKALAIDPNYAEAYEMIGETLKWDELRRAEAIAAFRSAIKIKPSLVSSYEHLGSILAYAKDEQGAEEVFRQGMAADPKRMNGRFALGRLLVKQGRLKDARAVWDGRTSDADDTMPRFIEALKRAENLQQATEALAQKPNDPEALVTMGLAVMEGDSWVVDGRQKRALVYFNKALKLKPDFTKAQYGICKAYIQGVDFGKDAKQHVDKEIAKLKKLDPALAHEMETYRDSYVTGLIGTPVKLDQ